MSDPKVRRMTAAELAPFAARRDGDEGGRRHIRELAESIRRLGFQPRKHGGMSGDTRTYPPSSPIQLVHDDRGSSLIEGNHRVRALSDIGYTRPVPVLVRDLRTRQPTPAPKTRTPRTRT